MHGLKLTEDQEDRIFAIRHAAAPALRDAAKALRKAHEALREFAMTPQYDENHLKALTEAVGKAESQLLLLRIRGEHELYGVLSPEQRAELKARRDRWESRDAGGPRGGPHGGTPPPPHG
jgi:Spy/CpxP family protein refolding chaperone